MQPAFSRMRSPTAVYESLHVADEVFLQPVSSCSPHVVTMRPHTVSGQLPHLATVGALSFPVDVFNYSPARYLISIKALNFVDSIHITV